MFIEDPEPGDVVDMHWGTLAEGPAFVRTDQTDNYKAAIYYEPEAILSSAVGAIASDDKCKRWLAANGWVWKLWPR